MTLRKKIVSNALILGISALLYGYLGYVLDRSDFTQYLIAMSAAFVCYVILFRWISHHKRGMIIGLALLLRLVFMVSTPTLSDDYNRFVWDGRLIEIGMSPYESSPDEIPESVLQKIDPEGGLFEGLNSPKYHSIYPPLNQGVFLVSTWIGGNVLGSIVVMRIFLLIAEALLIISLFKIGRQIGRPKAVLLYAFNPLVITEISGNLHFEGIVALFVVVGLWALYLNRYIVSAFLVGTAAAVKLTPFIFFPAMLNDAHKSGVSAGWLVLAGLTFGLAGWWIFPFEQWLHVGSSIGLYFQSFEFNASLYYLARGVGLAILNYNPIAMTGWLMPLIGGLIILTISFNRKSTSLQRFAGRLVLIGTTYLLFATTVHPWYLIPIIALSVLSRFTFPIVWSFFIVLSYSAYNNAGYAENGWLIALEYSVVLTWIFLELTKPKLIDDLNRKIWGETP